LCKAHGLSTVVETCGYANTDLLLKSAEFVDLFLWDIKDTDSARHKEYTGVSNELILDNLVALNEAEAKIRLRCILVNGVNTNSEHYSHLADIAKKIINLDGIEFIPYHAYGGTKSVFLGYSDSGKSEWIPTDEQLIEAKSILRTAGVKVV
jgi:pyruvate formate lyase activating enzyme